MDVAFLAIDWGTTNRRIYAVAADGHVIDSVCDDRGVLAMAAGDYAADLAALRAPYGAPPVVAAGMVGSTRGWWDVPYVSAPASMTDLAAGVTTIDQGITIVPGVAVRTSSRADVMRGEEVQVLGAIVAGLAPADAIFCQPGTHNKWVTVENGRITDFSTALTGELFALLRGHGILAGMLDGAVRDGPAFRDGVARGRGATDLAVALFEVRAAVLLGLRPAHDAAAYASGVLIGNDVGTRGNLSGVEVHLLADGVLADLYASAVGMAGGRALTVNSHRAFVAGARHLWKLTR